MRRDVDAAVTALAMPRAGAFLREEARKAGADDQLERRRRRSGVWIDRGGGVLVLAPHPGGLDQERWVGLLAGGAGAHLSFEAAAELHRLDGVRRGRAVVSVRHAAHPKVDGITFHQLDDVEPDHLMVVQGFLTTTPARTILDLAAVVSFVRLRAAVEDAIVRRLTTFGELARLLRTLRRPGKPGIRKLLLVLDSLAGEPPPASKAEQLLHRAAARAGVQIVRQRALPARPLLGGLVDAAVESSKLILEADSRTWHGRLQAMAKDRARDREAARQGWLPMRFLYEELDHDLEGCADDIRATHLERLGSTSRG
jgi:very-short-patch-repair endonuclease